MDKSEKSEGTLSQGDINSLIEAAASPEDDESMLDESIETAAAPSTNEDHPPAETSSQTGQADLEKVNSQYSVNIQRVLDISLPVTVSFGATTRSLSEVLKLAPGTLLELDKAAEDPVALKVNDKVFAWGKVVDVDGYYGVEITDIMTQADRIVSLGEV